MLRILLLGLLLLATLAGGWCLLGGSADARPEFKRYFDQKYFPAKGEKTAMQSAYTVSSCNFCHIGGSTDEERKNRNVFGQALAKRLTKKDAEDLSFANKPKNPDAFKKAEEKVLKGLEAVEKEHIDPKDAKSPTFGDLLKEGKLPKSPAKTPHK
jgi:hypothetical protein